MNDIQARFDVLRPTAGDTIAVHVDTRWLTREQRDYIRAQLCSALPDGVKVAVLTSDVTLEHIVAPEPTPQSVEVIHFDTWMRERTERAHASFMEQTSMLHRCDRRETLAEALARYFGDRQY